MGSEMCIRDRYVTLHGQSRLCITQVLRDGRAEQIRGGCRDSRGERGHRRNTQRFLNLIGISKHDQSYIVGFIVAHCTVMYCNGGQNDLSIEFWNSG